MAGNYTFDSPRAKYQIERITAALAEQPSTLPQLMGKLHLSNRTLYRYLAHLGKPDNRRVRVSGYIGTAGDNAPVYALGSAPDKPSPPPIDGPARNRASRARMKGDTERMDKHRAKQRIQKKLAKLKGKPQAWFSALM